MVSRRKSSDLLPGVVRFVGLAKVVKIRAASGTEYVFRKSVDAEVLPGDWAWIESIQDDKMRFEVVHPPMEPEESESAVPVAEDQN